MKKELSLESKREAKTFFHLFMPTVILLVLSFTNIKETNGILILGLVKILLALWQYVSLKNYVESTV